MWSGALFYVSFSICFIGLLFCLTSEATNKQAARNQKKTSKTELPHPDKLISISKDELKKCINVAVDIVQKLTTHERNIDTAGITQNSIFHNQMVDSLPSDEALQYVKDAVIAVKTTQFIADKYCHSRYVKSHECIDQLNNIDLHGTVLGDRCAELYEKDDCRTKIEKYRTTDGSCNKPLSPAAGKSNTAYGRLIRPDYDNGLFSVRGSQIGPRQLPSARLVTTTITDDQDVFEKSKTLAVPIWGLFIGQDMAFTPASNMVTRKTPITCCTADGRPLSPRFSHIACAAINIPKDDVFYEKFFQTCMNYVRSVPAVRPDCRLGPLEQINQVTHFLDGSTIYGSTEKQAGAARLYEAGKLASQPGDKQDKCYHHRNSSFCYNDGNSRVVFQPQLHALQSVFESEHNRIASKLAELNPNWDDERLYQEARRIVIGEIQHITYNRWLPFVLGEKQIKNLSVATPLKGYAKVYDKFVDPTVSNVFATAGIPALNSMIDGDIGLYTEDRVLGSITNLRDHITKDLIAHGLHDFIIRGIATQTSQKLDVKYSDALTRYWYTPSEQYGMDVLSLDIQKSRDHGLAGYIHFRKACQLSKISSFNDLKGIMSDQVVSKLEDVYRKIEDIDVLIGIIAELPLKDALVGPTLSCILGEQFVRTRKGDRHFYDNGNQVSSFTDKQLAQIKNANLARIFCDNTAISKMQLNVFQKPDTLKNKLLPCKDPAIKSIDLNLWKE